MIAPGTSIPKKQYVVLGETGQGKSTFIDKSFRSSYRCKIGKGRKSETLVVEPYYHSENTPDQLKNCVFYDSMGFLDTENWKEAEILEQIAIGILKARTKNETIDGFIIFESTKSTRSRLKQFFAELQSIFSVDFVRSTIVAINRYSNQTEEEVQEVLAETRETVSEIISCSRIIDFNIPIVIINCDAHADIEIANLSRALSTLQPYQLKNLAKKKQEIDKIYQDMINDSSNMRIVIKPSIIYRSEINTTQVKVESTRSEQHVYDEPWFYLFGLPIGNKKVNRWDNVPFTEIKEVQVEVMKPEIHEEEIIRLINSNEYYKELALKTYVDRNMSMYLDKTRR